MRVQSRKCHVQRCERISSPCDKQRITMRKLLWSCATHKSTVARAGNFSRCHESEIPEYSSEIRQRGEAVNRVLPAACEQVHFGVQQHSVGDACIRWARRKQCLRKKWFSVKKSQSMRWAQRSLSKHSVFALIVRHSEWILGHLVSNDSMVDDDNRVIKTSPYESCTGSPVPRSTQTAQSYPGKSTRRRRQTATISVSLVSGSLEAQAK